MEEAHNSQRLFFISKELQLNTKFHYMEVTATSENYKISLCISKITVKRKPLFTSVYTLSRQKTTRKGKRKRIRESAKEKGRGRERKRRKRRKRNNRRKKKEKMEKALLKVFSSTPPPPDTFPSTVPSLGIAREQLIRATVGMRNQQNLYPNSYCSIAALGSNTRMGFLCTNDLQ